MKVAIITGAASGIGFALTCVYLNRGITVVMVDKDLVKLKNEALSLSKEYGDLVVHFPCDITKPNEVEALVHFIDTQFERIDWIYNNAGIIGSLAPVWELTTEEIRQVMEVNLYGMIHIIRAFIPRLLKQETPSHIINMASLYALCSSSQTAAYSMSKHAVLALSESLYFDLSRQEQPVRISVAFPSFTDTSLLTSKSDDNIAPFHESLNSLLSHSRPAKEVAEHIIQEVEQNRFYIMPDKEVKGYCDERTKSILLQEPPCLNPVEKIIGSLINRNKKRALKNIKS